MRLFINNIKILFNRRLILPIAICFIVNIIYNGSNFPCVLCGVKNGFELSTAIPWIATVFPLFIITGAYFTAIEASTVFILSRIKSINKFYAITYITMFFITLVYYLVCSVVAMAFGGTFSDTLHCFILLTVNQFFIVEIQYIIYLLKRSVSQSLGTVLIIILLSLVFPKLKCNIGSCGMLIRSGLKSKCGFNIFTVIIIQFIFTAFNIIVFLIKGKVGSKEKKCQ